MENSVKIGYDVNNINEPKLSNRFVIEFDSNVLDIESWLVQTLTLPKFKKDKWENMTFTFLDTIQYSSTEALCNFIKKLQIDKEMELNFTVKILDPVGEIVETWNIVSDFDSVDFGDLSYDKSKLRTLFLTVSPKICLYENRFK